MDNASNQPKPRVVFFGSGPVAAASLALLLEWCEVEAVITKPQPAHHREAFPVLALAEKHGLRTLTARTRRELDEVMAANQFTSRVAILIDYGIIVSQAVIDSFELGIVNSHFSLLPEWRGADPITFAILSGQEQTGVSLMMLVEKMDEGPLLSQGIYDLADDISTPLLTAQLVKLSDSLLRSAIPVYLSGKPMPNGQPLTPTSQEEVMCLFDKPFEPTYSRKLTKEDGQLDFKKPAVQLEREVRAFAEWPKSRTVLAGKDVVITAAHTTPNNDSDLQPGDVTALPKEGILTIETSKGQLCVDKLKPAGKTEMDAKAFLAGNKF